MTETVPDRATHEGNPTSALRGRTNECDAINQLIATVRGGRSQMLVLRGEAGIGKTALLDYMAGAAHDFTVLRAVGVESEKALAFAALHQLCAPILSDRDRLPTPQREALEVVFGLSTRPVTDQFLVGLAVLSLVTEVAHDRPLLCIVDDAQWLDDASARTLAFVARRLRAEPVGLFFAAREIREELYGLPELAIRGLRSDDARALLSGAVRFMVDERVRDRIVAETGGNPLALLELPRGLTATQLAGGFGLLDPQQVPGRIEAGFRLLLSDLPVETTRLLLVAAADPVGDPLLVWRAAERLGINVSAAAPAKTAGLLAIADRVTFRHPLVRSAVYQSARPAERRATHLALAGVTDPEHDPDRRAWHLAAAAFAPDEGVADALERSAKRAQARGGLAAAAAFLRRSVELTRDPAKRVNRALEAAHLSLQAGVFDLANNLLATAAAGPLDDFQRARINLLRAQAAFSQHRGGDASPPLLRAAAAIEQLDPAVALDTYLDGLSAALVTGRFASAGALAEASRVARVAARPHQPARFSELLLDGLSMLFTDGRTAADPVLARAATGFAAGAAQPDEVLRHGWLAAAAALAVWDYDVCLAVASRAVQLARDAGALSVLAVSVNVLAQTAVLGGDFERAATSIAESDAVIEATGTRIAPYAAVALAGFRGQKAVADELIDATIADATTDGQGAAIQYAHWARSVVLNGLGQYELAATSALEASDDTPEMFVSAWALSELVEAAMRSGQRALADEAVARIGEHTNASDSDWARGMHSRARALVSDAGSAEGLYAEAIEALGRTQLRPELARAHLLNGEWLRREGRRVDAQAHLRIAHTMFSSIGMEAFTERSRRELSASGETLRKSGAGSTELTPQEMQIALLARDGLTNPEVGERLFISARTVEWHLRKVFTKLSIASRRELRNALVEPELRVVPERAVETAMSG
jgi:DNA-binding CsgD family transcriptional regulator